MLGALVLARRAGFFVIPDAEPGVVQPDEDILHFGQHASPGEIATLACRRMLRKRGIYNEAQVLRAVEARGYSYVPLHQPIKATA